MKHSEALPLVTTIKEKCRVCYTCVRECPAKAIRIADGQAEVMEERCIGCGNCVRVCSQKAKNVLSAVGRVNELLAGPSPVAACVAPSFPAEFADLDPDRVVGMIRALGFDIVSEVAFGADLVARCFRDLLHDNPNERYIATSCPAVVGYVERFHPKLVERLAPIVSPMVAMARVMHRLHGDDLPVVFIGPCIAKKGESASELVEGDIAAALTFRELREMFQEQAIVAADVEPSDFDGPHPGKGALFPITRGMLQAADIVEDLMEGDVVATDGRDNFASAIREFETGAMDARLLEVLCCNGCIMGAGMTVDTPLFRRRSQVGRYVRHRMERSDKKDWLEMMERLEGVDLSRDFRANNQHMKDPSPEEVHKIMEEMGKRGPEDELNCGACGYATCLEHAIAIYKGRAEVEMCLPRTIDKLRNTVRELASTQEALVNSEKLASMGQLAAGIAHEVNNPLGVVLMYAHLMLEELGENSEAGEDLRMIVEQADRCKKIVAGLLNFARQNKVEHRQVNVVELIDRTLRVASIPTHVEVAVNHELDDPMATLDADQITQVFTNLVNNAVAAMEGCSDAMLTIHTTGDEDRVIIEVGDTGTGIPEAHRKRIFEPFFSTKSAGKGTGLGLSVSYGIVKMHRGDISVRSNTDPAKGPTGTTFRVVLSRRQPEGRDAVEAAKATAREGVEAIGK